MSSIGLLIVLAFYVSMLFYIAHWAEKKAIQNGQIMRTSTPFR